MMNYSIAEITIRKRILNPLDWESRCNSVKVRISRKLENIVAAHTTSSSILSGVKLCNDERNDNVGSQWCETWVDFSPTCTFSMPLFLAFQPFLDLKILVYWRQLRGGRVGVAGVNPLSVSSSFPFFRLLLLLCRSSPNWHPISGPELLTGQTRAYENFQLGNLA